MKDFSEFEKELYDSGKLEEFISSQIPEEGETINIHSADGIAHLLGMSQSATISVFMNCLAAYHEWLAQQLEK